MSSPTDTAQLTSRPNAHPPHPHHHDVGLLILRVALGIAMTAHGSQKLFGWFDGGGLEGTEGFFDSLGYPVPGAFALLTAVIETFGGLALVVGLLTPLAGAATLGTMLNILAVKWGSGFFAPEGMEYELVLAALAVAVTLAGPGRYALDSGLPVLRDHRLSYGVAAAVGGAVVAGVVLLLRG